MIEDLSNWYVRLNKKRLWGSGIAEDKLSAYQTLYEVLKDIALLSAPIAPFYSERLWLDLVPGADSVHFHSMPVCDDSLVDKALEERMVLAQKSSSMVLALRKKVGINVRKPLSRLVIPVLNDSVKEQFELVKNIILIRNSLPVCLIVSIIIITFILIQLMPNVPKFMYDLFHQCYFLA